MDEMHYKVTQTEFVCQIVLPTPEGKRKHQFFLRRNKRKSEIAGYFVLNDPVISGRTWDAFEGTSMSEEDNFVTIVVTKRNPGIWPCLFRDGGSKGLDPQSLYDKGIYDEREHRFDLAIEEFRESASKGFLPAIRKCIDIFLGKENGFSQELINPAEALDLLAKIPPEKRPLDIIEQMTKTNNKIDVAMQLRQILEDESVHNSSSKYQLACLLSPLFGMLDEPEAAVQLLEELVIEKDPNAMVCLARHLFEGCGCKEDRTRAQRLIHEAQTINPAIEIFTIEKTIPLWKKVLFGSSISLGTLILTGLFLRRRKH